MKTPRRFLQSAALGAAALVLLAGCGMKGPLLLPEAETAKSGSAQPTGGTSRAPQDDDGTLDATRPNADGELADPADDE